MKATLTYKVPDVLAEDSTESVWASIARGYEAFGSPLVPCHEDIEAIEGAVAKHAERTGAHPVRAVMLGVTPGLALMNWPRGARILGVEMSQAVINALWPGDIPGVRKAICASWFSLSAEREKYHVVVGDGSFSTCRFPGKVRDLVHAIRKLLVEDGMLAFRSYVRPHIQETVDAVFDDLLGNKGLTVDCFKMRLYLAMQRTPQEGVALSEAARVLDRHGLDARIMQDSFGWSSAAVEPFVGWRNSRAIYSFPSVDELCDVLRECFDDVSVTYPGYELGHCCPTLVMRPWASKKVVQQGI